jgi:hypothetical protein
MKDIWLGVLILFSDLILIALGILGFIYRVIQILEGLIMCLFCGFSFIQILLELSNTIKKEKENKKLALNSKCLTLIH